MPMIMSAPPEPLPVRCRYQAAVGRRLRVRRIRAAGEARRCSLGLNQAYLVSPANLHVVRRGVSLLTCRIGCSLRTGLPVTIEVIAKADVQAIFVQHAGSTPASRKGAIPFRRQDRCKGSRSVPQPRPTRGTGADDGEDKWIRHGALWGDAMRLAVSATAGPDPLPGAG